MRLLCAVILLTSLHLLSGGAARADSSKYAYIYLSQAPRSGVQVHVVEPSSLTETSFTVPTPTGYSYLNLTDSALSPDGHWIALTYTQVDSPNLAIQLIQLATQQARDVTALRSLQQTPVWSPDSKYLAFGGRRIADARPGIYLYTLADQTIADIYQADVFALAWSPDSAYLLTAERVCTSDCKHYLKLFAIPAGVLAVFQYINAEILGSICDFNWSPNGKYVTFEAGCDIATVDVYREVYLWDRARLSVQRLTTYTNPLPPPDTGIKHRYSANYSAVWYTPDKFLLSANVAQLTDTGIKPESLVAQTMDYHSWPEDNSYAVILPRFAADWARNPITGVLAYRAIGFNAPWPSELMADYADVELIKLNGIDWAPVFSAPPGCHLRWSPDGALLAYANIGSWTVGSRCENPHSIIILDSSTGKTREHPVPAGSRPIGWMPS